MSAEVPLAAGWQDQRWTLARIRALYDELAKDSLLPATRAKFQAAITDLVTRGAEVIILACTEFGMLVKPHATTEAAFSHRRQNFWVLGRPPR